MEINPYVYFHTTSSENNLVFNGLTGGINILSSRLANMLAKKDFISLSQIAEEELIFLQESNYISEDFRELVDLVYSNYQIIADENLSLNHFIIVLSYNCNLNCPYCFERNNCNREIKPIINYESITTFINNKVKINPNDSIIEFFGGEPLLLENIEILNKLLEFSKNNHIKVNFVTNGTTLNYFNEILFKYNDIIGTIQITIDGFEDKHNENRFYESGEGTFMDIMKNIQTYCEEGFNISLRVNVTKDNLTELNKITEYLFENNYYLFDNFDYYFAPITSDDKISTGNLIDEADLAIYLDSLNQVDKGMFTILGYIVSSLSNKEKRLPSFQRCYANNVNNFIISPEGFLYDCCEELGTLDKVGTIFDDVQVLKNKYNNVLNEGLLKCRSCNIALLCGGGCLKGREKKEYCDEQHRVLSKYFDYIKQKFDL